MRTERLVESVETTVVLSVAEATAIEAAGRRLAWSRGVDGRTVIRCRPLGGRRFAVRVADAIGVVATPDVQLVIEPKIAVPHLLYLLTASKRFPRLDPARAVADADVSFWQLVARWYLDQLQRIVHRDLMRDYKEFEDQLSILRGRVLPLPTARSFYLGEPKATCRFEDYGSDNPLNRVLKAAALVIAGSSILPADLRRKAMLLLRAFADVGELQHADLFATVARENQWYADALALARSILDGHGRGIRAGDRAAWTFLFPTPLLVEEGVRRLIGSMLPDLSFAKVPLTLGSSRIQISPDIVVGDREAVADVKYKLIGSNWNRPDLYQVVSFAAGFKTKKAALIGFTDSQSSSLPTVTVGEIVVASLIWRTGAELAPAEAADSLCEQVRSWIHDPLMALV